MLYCKLLILAAYVTWWCTVISVINMHYHCFTNYEQSLVQPQKHWNLANLTETNIWSENTMVAISVKELMCRKLAWLWPVLNETLLKEYFVNAQSVLSAKLVPGVSHLQYLGLYSIQHHAWSMWPFTRH